jgi:toxin-antitoxin system PIN domain toxin
LILVDANLLVYAHDDSHPQHRAAHRWLEDQLNSSYRVGLPWPSVLAFLRLTTNPRISATPFTPQQAWSHVETWFSSPSAWVPQPGDAHARLLGGLLTDLSLTGNLVPDAHLAVLAIEHGLTLCSADSDFARFPDLRWTNPLAG